MLPSKNRTRRYLTFAILLTGLALFMRGCVLRPATDYTGAYFNRGRNAVWLGVEWVNTTPHQAAVETLAYDLQPRDIHDVFVYVSYLNQRGEFNHNYAYAGEFLRMFRATQPAINVLAWYGVPMDYVDLSRPAVRNQIVRFSRMLVAQFGFDGIHADPKPVHDNDPHLLTLLTELRQALPAPVILSIATKVIAPIFPDTLARWTGQWMWSSTYYRAVAEQVDQIALMTYDSTLTSPVLYRLWTRFQVIQTSQALAQTPVELLIGVPTSEEETATHHIAAENMRSGLQGIIDGLNDAETISTKVTGVAIYPAWETDAQEWAVYEQLWLGQSGN